LIGKKRDVFHGLKAGLLSAMCYPDAGCPQLRVVNDYLTYLFHLDNLSDDMDNRGTRATADVVLNSLYHPHTDRSSARVGRMTREYVNCIRSFSLHLISLSSYYKRLVLTASTGTQQRFIETFDFFFQAVTQQASDRAAGIIPDLESYIALRRDTSGCKPCWALIECNFHSSLPFCVTGG
jgi:Terpene synthase family 2, C-terminal metal binding